jgi:hypothetical protein
MNRTWLAAAGLALLALAGCDAAPGGDIPDIEAKEVRPVSPAPPLVTPPPAAPAVPPRRSDCVSSTEQATARQGESPGRICLIVGATLHVTSTPSPNQPWPALQTSDASVLRCKSSVGPDGTLDAGCQAEKAGVAMIGSGTWRLTVDVLA